MSKFSLDTLLTIDSMGTLGLLLTQFDSRSSVSLMYSVSRESEGVSRVSEGVSQVYDDSSWVSGVVSLSASESNSLSICLTILNLSLCLLN